MPIEVRARAINCPACAGRTVYAASNPWRPFCSERCRTIDLGAWANERFRVVGGSLRSDDDLDPLRISPDSAQSEG
jgi:endogenous inhibitor of DNA gyrase (YacG/DUF329 family)